MTVLDFAVTHTSYVTSIPLIPGVNYAFKVESRNEAGFSDYSNIAVVLAAQIPN